MSRRALMLSSQQNLAKQIKYGYLYNWYATQGTGNNSIIPSAMESAGWVVPTLADTQTLWSAVGGYSTAGKKLKSNSALYWVDYQSNTNIYNMDIRGAGNRYGNNGSFVNLLNGIDIWLNENGVNNTVNFSSYYDGIGYNSRANNYGNSIRFMRIATTQEQSQANGTVTNNGYTGNDGTKYPIIKLGAKMWLACNLAETKFRDGSSIPNVVDNTAWTNLTTPGLCAYNNNENNVYI